jgi:hypothetical protein
LKTVAKWEAAHPITDFDATTEEGMIFTCTTTVFVPIPDSGTSRFAPVMYFLPGSNVKALDRHTFVSSGLIGSSSRIALSPGSNTHQLGSVVKRNAAFWNITPGPSSADEIDQISILLTPLQPTDPLDLNRTATILNQNNDLIHIVTKAPATHRIQHDNIPAAAIDRVNYDGSFTMMNAPILLRINIVPVKAYLPGTQAVTRLPASYLTDFYERHARAMNEPGIALATAIPQSSPSSDTSASDHGSEPPPHSAAL